MFSVQMYIDALSYIEIASNTRMYIPFIKEELKMISKIAFDLYME